MVTLTLTSNTGSMLLQKARSIATTCNDRADAQASIVLVYSALEAFVSELEWLAGRDTADPSMQQLAVFLDALEANHAPIRNKLDAISVTFTARRSDWGRSPFQDLAHLKIVRDWCVHPKPVVGTSDENLAEAPEARFLVQRGVIDDGIIGNHVTWDNIVLVKPVAEWACITVDSVIADVLGQLPPSHAATRARLSWRRDPVVDDE